MLLAIIDSLAPVFTLIALGWLLRRTRFLTAEALEHQGHLAYWVGIPCLLFSKIASSSAVPSEAGHLFIVTVTSTGLGMILSYLLALSLRIPKAALGTFVQAAFRGNLAFVGLPVIVYAFSNSGGNPVSAEASTLLVFGPMVVLYNVTAVLVLLISRHGINVQTLRPLLGDLVTNPLLLACLAGVLYSTLNLPLPTSLKRSLDAVGQMALPLALICLGGSLHGNHWHESWLWSGSAAVAKVVLMPLLGYAVARLTGLNPDSTRIALILLACPTAAASYVLVNQIGGDEALASGAIVFSTLLATFSLALVLVVT